MMAGSGAITGIAWVMAVLVCEGLDRWAVGRGAVAIRRDAHLVLRGCAYSLLFLFWLALSARAAFAATAAAITTAVFLVISGEKRRHLTEPLVITDLAFITHLVRHPELFYLGWRKTLGVAAVALGLVALIVTWMQLEPRSLSGALQAALAAGLALLALAAYGWPRWVLGLATRAQAAVAHEPAHDFVARLGLMPSLLVSAVALRALPPPAPRAAAVPASPPRPAASVPLDAVVVIQSESFYDLRRHGGRVLLPAFDGLKGRALAHGRLLVPCYGAYTLRPEFALATGLPFTAQGVDRFHPYLRPHRFAGHALPADLARAGWDTVFMHPYDRHFFGRARAIPALGYGRFVSEADFAGAERFGPYVADRAVGARMEAELLEARRRKQPLYMMTVTMEAHDPYGPGRLTATDDPVEQYCQHIANADALLAAMVAALDAHTGHSLLVFYGDHAPLLPGFGQLAADARTDYIVVECGSRAPMRSSAPAASSECSPAGLNEILRRMVDSSC